MTGKTTYRTHTCGEIGEQNLNCNVRLSGWVENIRDHGGIQFLDLRDHYGVVQVVIHEDSLLDRRQPRMHRFCRRDGCPARRGNH